MQLELGKTYRCLNGAQVNMIRSQRTISGGIERLFGEIVEPLPHKMLIEYYPNGVPVMSKYNGYATGAEIITKPELMFSFSRGVPECRVTVSESEISEAVVRARTHHIGDRSDLLILADAAERMVELANARPLTPFKIGSHPGGVRGHLEELLRNAGLDVDKYLTKLKQETKPMCDTKPTPKAEAERAAGELSNLMSRDLGINVTPILLRLWLVERWDEVSKLAHKIHGSA